VLPDQIVRKLQRSLLNSGFSEDMSKLIGVLLIVSLCLVLLSACSTPAVTTSSSKYPISGVSTAMGAVPAVSFELAAPLPDFPDKLQVYKMVKPDIAVDYVKALGVKFGLAGEISEWTKNFLMSDNVTRTYLEVYKATGTLRYYKLSYFEIPSDVLIKKPPVLPSDTEALRIATDFLLERDLLPKEDVAYKVEVGGSFGGIPTHLLVSFKHAIEIEGPGALHAVRIGDGGEVVEVFINPTNPLVLPVQEMVAAKPITQAYQEMQTTKNYSAPTGSRKVKIDNASIAYWIEAIDKGQDYVAPVYIFKGTCLDEAGKQLDTPFGAIIEALK
jgi:hypothetical protein